MGRWMKKVENHCTRK